MGKKSRRKGYRLEHELVTLLKELGFEAQKIPLSGLGTVADIIINGKKAEIKGRSEGFKSIYKWLEEVDILFVRANKKEWLVIQRLKDLKL